MMAIPLTPDDPRRVGDPEPYTVPRCPVCGSECDMLYRDKDGDIVGCDECVTTKDAWEWQQEQEDEQWQ